MSRGPAYVPPTPGSFPHQTPGGPVAAHGDTVTPAHIGQVMDALQAQGHALQARGQNFTKLMGAMQQQNRDAMGAMQAQFRDARRTADAAAADATAMYPRLNS
eukprot:6738791-Prymnesium_polylepis.1